MQPPEAKPDPPRPSIPAGITDPLPDFSPGARAELAGREHLREVLEAYYRPQWTAQQDDAVERRSAHGCLIAVSKSNGAVLFVGTSDQSDAEPESLRAVHRPKRTKRGGSGTTWPTTYDEVLERLKETSCTVEPQGTHQLVVTLPNGTRKVLRRNTSDFRAVRNFVTQLRALGVDLRR